MCAARRGQTGELALGGLVREHPWDWALGLLGGTLGALGVQGTVLEVQGVSLNMLGANRES